MTLDDKIYSSIRATRLRYKTARRLGWNGITIIRKLIMVLVGILAGLDVLFTLEAPEGEGVVVAAFAVIVGALVAAGTWVILYLVVGPAMHWVRTRTPSEKAPKPKKEKKSNDPENLFEYDEIDRDW